MSSQQIAVLLEKMVQGHQKLNALSERKTEVLKSGDVKMLELLLREENLIVRETKQYEESRKSISTLPFSEWIQHVPGEERAELENLQKELLQEVERLKGRNELNQQLLQQSLQFVNMSLNMLRPEPEKSTYSRPASLNHPSTTQGYALFDSKA